MGCDYEWPPLTLRERIAFAFEKVYVWFEWRLRGARCLLTRHDVWYGSYETGEPDWCKRCWRDNPNEERTLWNLPHNCYGFVLEHSRLFRAFDDWVCTFKLQRWLPSWWEW